MYIETFLLFYVKIKTINGILLLSILQLIVISNNKIIIVKLSSNKRMTGSGESTKKIIVVCVYSYSISTLRKISV